MPTDTAPPVPALEHLRFDVRGMTCASCVRRVERALTGVEGVERASVNLATEQASIEAARDVDVSALRAAVDRAGYDLRLPAANEDPDDARDALEQERHAHFRALAVRTAFALTVAAVSMAWMLLHTYGFQLFGWLWIHDLAHSPWTNVALFAVTLPVQVWAGAPFYVGAWKIGRHGSTDMNSLVALGTSAAFLYSAVVTFAPGLFEGTQFAATVYYDTATAIIGSM